MRRDGLRRVRFAIPLLAVLCWLIGGAPAAAQVIQPPFDQHYFFVDLGPVPGVPPSYGGLTFKLGDPNTILIGGNANDAPGKLYAIGVVRDANNHVTGFTGTATEFADAAYNDGGVTYGPGNVLFLARWPVNEVGQTKLGSSVTDKSVGLDPFGVTPSVAGLTFVPPGYPGAGGLKIVSWEGGEWYTLTFSPDGQGTFDITSATRETTVVGGPEGFIYVPPGSRDFTDFQSMLVSEWSAGNIAAYLIDVGGNPIPATRVDFMTGLTGAEGALVDPLTGDFLFSTFGGGDRVIVVQGFAPPPPPPAIQGSLSVGAAPVEGATVSLKQKGVPGKATTTTDATGTYQFDPVAPGSYKIKVQEFVVGAISTVSGNVVVKGMGLAGAKVKLKNLDTGVKVKTTTDGSGNFSFPGVSPGNYRLIISTVSVPARAWTRR
jgi:hypothetical protein